MAPASRAALEVLFDGRPEADAQVTADTADVFYGQLAADRKLLTVPADPAASGQLASRYKNAALGEIAVSRPGGTTVFDFGEWKSEVASRTPTAASRSSPRTRRAQDFEFVVGAGAKRTLVLRDSQHQYVFEEQ